MNSTKKQIFKTCIIVTVSKHALIGLMRLSWQAYGSEYERVAVLFGEIRYSGSYYFS